MTREKELEEIIKQFLECPRWIDEATMPKNGIEANPDQVVFNMSCSYVKMKRAHDILGMKIGI